MLPKGYKHSEETKSKIGLANSKSLLGHVVPEEVRKKISKSLSKDKSYAWKGDEAGYFSKHSWINRHFIKPDKCEICGVKSSNFNWCSKNHKYTRNIKDYLYLCVSCHKKYDLKFNIKHKVGKCKVCGKNFEFTNWRAFYCSAKCKSAWHYKKNSFQR